MDTGCSRVSRPNWFIGLPLPRQADWHQASLTAPPELRRFHPADLHLTVAFLGPCGLARAEAAWLALAPHASAAMTVSAGSWRALGPARQPSAYGLLLDQGRVELEQLLARWGAFALEAAGCADSRRPPLPHVTLLRPNRYGWIIWRFTPGRMTAANGCFASSINASWIRQHGRHSSPLSPWPVRAAAAGPSGPIAAWADAWSAAAAVRRCRASSGEGRARGCCRRCPAGAVGVGGFWAWL